MKSPIVWRLGVYLVLLSGCGQAFAFEWRDLWQTPEQRAAALYRQGDFDQLAKEAPDDIWRALAADAKGDHQQALADLVLSAGLTNDSDDTQLLYNLATAAVKAGDYQQAISVFDDVLLRDTDHESARHNKAITEKLLEQQQSQAGDQSQEGEQSEDGEQGQEGEQSQDGDQSQEGEQSQDGEQSQEGEQSQDDEQNQEGEQSQDGEQGEGGEQEQLSEQEAAEERRKAEALLQQDGDASESEATAMTEVMEDLQPLTEQQQSAEQLLRRIPDDPAGLLRSKLRQNHNTLYPEIPNSETPW